MQRYNYLLFLPKKGMKKALRYAIKHIIENHRFEISLRKVNSKEWKIEGEFSYFFTEQQEQKSAEKRVFFCRF